MLKHCPPQILNYMYTNNKIEPISMCPMKPKQGQGSGSYLGLTSCNFAKN